jgi:predicted nucleic acid-binding protein
MIVLDTNVLSELLRPRPDPRVETWLASRDASMLFFTTVGEAELRHGIALLPAGRRRQALGDAVDAILDQDLRDRILPFDRAAARAYAQIAVIRRAAGRPISQFDCQIVAIASAHGAAVATRNVADYLGCGVPIIDPWQPDTR